MNRIEKLDISKFLPHQKPILMVDKVLSIDNNHVITSFEIKYDCIFVQNDTLSEVGLIENVAQTCSSIVGRSYFEKDDLEGNKNKIIGFISSLKNVEVNQCPSVGESIKTKANLITRYDGVNYKISTMQCSIFHDEKELLSCEINLFIQELNS